MTLYVVQARGADEEALVKAHFIKDGFAWAGFAFGWLWLVYHRLWLPAVLYVVIETAFLVLALPHIAPETVVLCDLLARFFVGLEGNRLREARGARRAALTEIIEAPDRDAAEVIFFSRHAAAGAPA